MPIRPYLQARSAFGDDEIKIMSRAFEDICAELRISQEQHRVREAIAARVIDLARSGVIDGTTLRDRVLAQARVVA